MTRYNPCGKVVAMLSAGYETLCRFNRDSDETATIRWYRALPGAETLGYPSAITPLTWLNQPEMRRGVGEVFNADRPFSKGDPILAATGTHVCGTEEDFRKGGVYDPEPPFMSYNSDGLAACCAPEPGGIVIGGSARVFEPFLGINVGGTVGKVTVAFSSCSDPDQLNFTLDTNGTRYQIVPYSTGGINVAWNGYRFLGGGPFDLRVEVFDPAVRVRVYTAPISSPCSNLTMVYDGMGGTEYFQTFPPAPIYRLLIHLTSASPFTLPWYVTGLAY